MVIKIYTIAFMLFLSGCSRGTTTEASDSNKYKRLEESQNRYAEIVESERLKQLAKSGNAVLNVPPRKIFNNTKSESQSGQVCYNLAKLSDPWFIVDVERHSKQWDTMIGYELVIAAASTELDIPFFEIKVEPPVDYAFVTPHQEYVYIMVSAIPLDFRVSSFAENINFHTKAIDGYYKPFEFDIRDYADWSFQTFSSNGFNDLVGIDKKHIASFKYRDAIEIIDDDNVTILGAPTGQFYSAPYAEGYFLHKSGKAIVKMKFSAKAIPQTPQLFEYAHKAVSEIIISCEDQ